VTLAPAHVWQYKRRTGCTHLPASLRPLASTNHRIPNALAASNANTPTNHVMPSSADRNSVVIVAGSFAGGDTLSGIDEARHEDAAEQTCRANGGENLGVGRESWFGFGFWVQSGRDGGRGGTLGDRRDGDGERKDSATEGRVGRGQHGHRRHGGHHGPQAQPWVSVLWAGDA
ncbi:hypothetical protein M427DRAFT_341381, partial [Gonapodya prolifera JEL478]